MRSLRNSSDFTQARIKLTGYYMLGLVVIIGLFTVLTLNARVSSFIRVESTVGELAQTPDVVREYREAFRRNNDSFRQRILLFDGLMCLVALAISWWLSGKTLQPIQKALTRQEYFAAEVSHELRTPLTNIRLEVETLLYTDTPMKTEVKMTFASILEEVTRMSHMIQGLLILVRTEKSEALVMERVNVNEIAKKTINLTTQIAHQRLIQIELISESEPAWVRGNSELLVQLLLILTDNALKYSPRRSTVRITVGRDMSGILIKVIDEGPGIPKEEQQLLFSRFYRGKSAASRSTGGIGLGLTIARRIVLAHAGTLQVRNNRVKGSTFEVRLPLQDD